MKFNIKCGRRAFAVVMLCALVMTSCSKTSNEAVMLATVPAKSECVVMVDFAQVLKRAGCTVNEGSIELTPAVRRLLGSGDDATGLAAAIHDAPLAVDLENVIMFTTSPNMQNLMVTLPVKDAAMLVAALESHQAQDMTEKDGVTYCRLGDMAVAVGERQAWMAESKLSTLMSKVAEFTSMDSEESLESLAGISEYLGGSQAVRVAVNAQMAALPGAKVDTWGCASVDIQQQVIGLHCTIMQGDGSQVSVTGDLQDISTDFLRYVPGSFISAAAVGIRPDVDWGSVAGMATMIIGYQAGGMINNIMPYLKSIDGTVAVAAGPAGGAPAIADVNLKTWDFLAMVHMSQAKVDEAIGLLGFYMQNMGKNYKKNDSMIQCDIEDGVTVYAANLDGYLAVSNREFDSACNNSMEDLFESRKGAFVLNVPADSEVVKAFGLPWGFDFNVQLTDNDLHARMSLNGTNESVLKALIEAGRN
ncbi:MAG: hypothetical protein K2M76_02800 [Muribaculaceae bacterium]|nr:hypothetical protein [Muribaculaceae bacterium]